MMNYFFRSMSRRIFLLTVFLASALSFGLGEEFRGKVVRVLDGDTIEVMHHGQAERIRLNGIDCPEKAQPFGERAKKYTSSLAFGETVTAIVKDTDRYGRTVAEILLPDGRSLNRELVKAGLAWWYRKYSTDATLGQLEAEARAARRGLWADSNPVPPWEWRHAAAGASKKKD